MTPEEFLHQLGALRPQLPPGWEIALIEFRGSDVTLSIHLGHEHPFRVVDAWKKERLSTHATLPEALEAVTQALKLRQKPLPERP
jgi:hypothetical protein